MGTHSVHLPRQEGLVPLQLLRVGDTGPRRCTVHREAQSALQTPPALVLGPASPPSPPAITRQRPPARRLRPLPGTPTPAVIHRAARGPVQNDSRTVGLPACPLCCVLKPSEEDPGLFLYHPQRAVQPGPCPRPGSAHGPAALLPAHTQPAPHAGPLLLWPAGLDVRSGLHVADLSCRLRLDPNVASGEAVPNCPAVPELTPLTPLFTALAAT